MLQFAKVPQRQSRSRHSETARLGSTEEFTMEIKVDWETMKQELLNNLSEDKVPEDVVSLLANVARRILHQPRKGDTFRLWERHGLHVLPVHYYSPIPDTRTLPDALWESESQLPGIDLNEAVQLSLLREVFPSLREEYNVLSRQATGCPHEFYFENGRFSGTDALALYCMIRHFRPGRILEVGSGFSSRLAAQAALKNGGTRLTCIEPYPDEVLRAGFPGLDSLIDKQVQDVPLAIFSELRANDILFIDSAHVVRIGGDVNYLFLEIIPRLRPGVIVHVHDIFFPKEYPREWVIDQMRFWNEQYLLQAFLAFNSAFEVLLCNSYLGLKHRSVMKATFPNSPWWGGGSFWMRRRV
jgi:hypothetical protein